MVGIPEAPRYRYHTTDKIVINGIDYTPDSSDAEGQTFRRVSNPDFCETFTHQEIHDFHQVGSLKRFPHFFSEVKARVRARTSQTHLADLPKVQQQTVLWRKAFCDGFLEMETNGEVSRSDASMEPAIGKLFKENTNVEMTLRVGSKRCGRKLTVRTPPTPTTLRKWLRTYEGLGLDPLSLMEGFGRSGNRKTRLPDDLYPIMANVAKQWAESNKPSKSATYEKLETELFRINQTRQKNGLAPLPMPSLQTFRKEISPLHYGTGYAGRHGESKARKDLKMVAEGINPTRPMERLEKDGWTISLKSLMVRTDAWKQMSKEERKEVERVSMTALVAIDCATRCVVGLHIFTGKATAEAAVTTLRTIVTDKSDMAKAAGCLSSWHMGGPFEAICTDQGSEFKDYEYRASVASLGAEIMYPPAGTPYHRARIERLNGTLHQKFIAKFHGRTFENVVAKGDYDETSSAVLTNEELKKLFVRFIVDVYHHTAHDGLNGRTPAQAWAELTRIYGTPPPVDDHVIHAIFSTIEERKLRRVGVEVFGLFYQSQELYEAFLERGGKMVQVRIDQHDLGQVSVRIGTDWLAVPCKQSGMDGVSLDLWVRSDEKARRETPDDADITNEIRLRALTDIIAHSDMATERAELMVSRYDSEGVRRLVRSWLKPKGRRSAADTDSSDFLETGKPASTPLAIPVDPSATIEIEQPATSAEPNDGTGSDDDDDDFANMEF